MTIKSHIAISATISLALIAIIACQQKTQAPKEEKSLNDKIKTQVTKVEDTAKKAQEAAAKAEAEAREAAKKAEEEAKAKEQIKEIENKVDDAAEKIESEVKAIESKIDDTTETKEEQGPKNLFVNSDFSDGLNGWSHDKDVSIVDIDGKNCVEIIGPSKGQTYIWQTINTISGHVYRLSFKVKAEQKGAFAIFRDDKKYEEKYLFADASANWKEYQKNFLSTRDGNYRVFLSAQAKGIFYFSDASIIDVDLEK